MSSGPGVLSHREPTELGCWVMFLFRGRRGSKDKSWSQCKSEPTVGAVAFTTKLQPQSVPILFLKDEMLSGMDQTYHNQDLQGVFWIQENVRIDPLKAQQISDILEFQVKVKNWCELLDSLTLSCFALEGSSFATGITLSKNGAFWNHCQQSTTAMMGKKQCVGTLHNVTLLSLLLPIHPWLRILVVKVCWRGLWLEPTSLEHFQGMWAGSRPKAQGQWWWTEKQILYHWIYLMFWTIAYSISCA